MIVCVSPGGAATCNAPSASYSSIQSAVDVINCTEIVVASGSFYENVVIGRTLEIQGVSSASTTIVGKVTVEGFGTKATLKSMTIAVEPEDLPYEGLVVVGDAEVIPDDLVIGTTDLNAADHIFSDGFESGDTALWSNTVP